LPKVVGNPLAAVLTPTIISSVLEPPPQVLQAGLEDEGVMLEGDYDMEGARDGVTVGTGMPQVRSWGINTDAPRYVTQTGKIVRHGRRT
jgi:hypothetical protein